MANDSSTREIKVSTVTSDYRFLDLANTVLDSLLAFNFPAPHQCKRGECGGCKATLISGAIEHINKGDSITQEEIDNGYFLACLSRPKENIHMRFLGKTTDATEQNIDINIVNAAKRQAGFKAVIIECKPVPQRVFVVKLKVDRDFKYIPGQYIRLGTKNISPRSYSIADYDSEKQLIELHLRNFKDGEMSAFFSKKPIGQTVSLTGPFGNVALSSTDVSNEVIGVSAGVGFGLVKSIFNQALSLNSKRKITLIHYRSAEEEVYDQAAIDHWKTIAPSFTYHDMVTRQNKNDTPRYVNNTLPELYKDLTHKLIYCAGPDLFTKDVIKTLSSILGYKTDKFFVDSFIPSSNLDEEENAIKEKSEEKKGFFRKLFGG
jgi:NAD(P)H-flavin reductase/ferredoxin